MNNFLTFRVGTKTLKLVIQLKKKTMTDEDYDVYFDFLKQKFKVNESSCEVLKLLKDSIEI